MHPNLRRLFCYVFLFGVLIPVAPIFASDFNPNYILGDDELQDAKSMTRDDIQAFLNSHGGAIASMVIPDASSTPRQVADIIYRAATDHNINPKYLLVKLQKEQSLTTDPAPTQKQLDWATGFGVCDSCSLSDPNIQRFKGFGVQVDSAAAIMRWYFDNLLLYSWIKRPGGAYQIDTTTVQPLSLATGFLYTYTPHIHGNENFWNLWQRWFAQVYPDGSLLKSDTDKTVYLLEDGKKRAFATMTALVSRYDPKLILTVPDSELARYPAGAAIGLPNYSIVQNGSQYYLIDYETLRPFESEATVRALGYNPDEIVAVTSDDLTGYQIGNIITATTTAPFGQIIKITETKKSYYVNNGVYHPLLDTQIAKINFPNLTSTNKSITSLIDVVIGDPVLFKDGTLLAVQGDGDTYVVEKGKKRHIASQEVFDGLGYNADNIVWTDEFTLMAHPTGEPIYLRNDDTDIALGDDPDVLARDPLRTSIGLNTKMIMTAAKKIKVTGPTFDTKVDSYLIADETGKILAGKNIDAVRPMASLAKVMTGYRLFKEGIKTWATTTYKPSEHKALYNNFRVASGEKIRNSDLLLSMLVSSVNQPARMLVDSVEKNESKFVARMNSQARTWGLAHTTFVDVTGENLKTKTTARDYLTLFRKATNNGDLRAILDTASYSYDEVVDKDGHPHHFDTNINPLLQKTDLPFTILASKTGYLDEAGAETAMFIERKSDKKRFYIITMGNPHEVNTFTDPERISRFALASFSLPKSNTIAINN